MMNNQILVESILLFVIGFLLWLTTLIKQLHRRRLLKRIADILARP
jgi:hypothetical protein